MKYTEENLSEQYGYLFFVCFIVTVPYKKKRGLFLCDCGKLTVASIDKVLISRTTSCGRCNEVSKEVMAVTKFGHLRQTNPKDTMPGSAKKDNFTCDCGRIINTTTANVFKGNTKSCGRCNEVSKEVMAVTKFGHLRQTNPKDTMPGSIKKDNFTCDCGRNKDIATANVFKGTAKTCGNCSLIVKQWHQENQAELKKLQCPIKPGPILNGPIYALKLIKKISDPFPAICPACKNEYETTLNAIKQGRRLTCTCVLCKISRQAVEIAWFVDSFGFEVKFEYKVNGLAYDIFVQSKNDKNKGLLIEYDGAHWHDGFPKSLEREVRKEKNAVNSGYGFLRIKESEWKKENRNNIKKQLTGLLGGCHLKCKTIL